MKLQPGAPIKGTRVDVAFLGSCTNGRLSDFIEAAKYLEGRRVHPSVKASAVPGSTLVKEECEKRGSDKVSINAGCEARAARCRTGRAQDPRPLARDPRCA